LQVARAQPTGNLESVAGQPKFLVEGTWATFWATSIADDPAMNIQPMPLPLFPIDDPAPSAVRLVPSSQPRPRPQPPSSLDGMPLLLTVSEAAVVLRIGRTTAYKLVDEWRTSDGRAGIPSVRLGGRVMVRRVDLEAMLHGGPPDAA
jgi:excisionase family DNA binding protein